MNTPVNGTENTQSLNGNQTSGTGITKVETPNFINIVNQPFSDLTMMGVVGGAMILAGTLIITVRGLGLPWDTDGVASTAVLFLVGLVLLMVDRADEE